MESVVYTVRRSRRARRPGVTVHCDGRVVVTLPETAPSAVADVVFRRYFRWIIRQLEKFRRFQDHVFLPRGRREYLARKEDARDLANSLLRRMNVAGRWRYGRVSIKDLRRNWGSCSRLGNLNFNYRLVHLPIRLAEYVVAHELCHLDVFNHSLGFWSLLGTVVPDWRERRRELRRYHP
jgi:predicted metal-dependent hydrolase